MSLCSQENILLRPVAVGAEGTVPAGIMGILMQLGSLLGCSGRGWAFPGGTTLQRGSGLPGPHHCSIPQTIFIMIHWRFSASHLCNSRLCRVVVPGPQRGAQCGKGPVEPQAVPGHFRPLCLVSSRRQGHHQAKSDNWSGSAGEKPAFTQ